MADAPELRKGMPSVKLDEPEFRKRFLSAGGPYPRHLEGRVFSVVVHGDVEGAENVRRSLAD